MCYLSDNPLEAILVIESKSWHNLGLDYNLDFSIHWDSWVTSVQVKGDVSSPMMVEVCGLLCPVTFLGSTPMACVPFFFFHQESCNELMRSWSGYKGR